jgi:hypothetical protein
MRHRKTFDALEQRILKPVFKEAILQLPPRLVRRCGEHLLRIASKRDAFFHTIDSVPKRYDALRHNLTDPVTPEPPGRIALVIQGPILEADDFTLQTVRYYRRVCPDMTVILSTWEDGPADAIHQCREAGAEVVLSPMPPIRGRANVNCQTTSTRAGIQRAGELGAQFVAKTRSDHRLYGVHCLYGLPGMLAAFPIKADSGQAARLVISTFHTFKYSPLAACDQFMFGALADMRTFWSPPSDPCTRTRHEIDREARSQTTIEGGGRESPERYLMAQFLRNMNEYPPFTILAWWQVIADRFMVIEWAQLDVYWQKYFPTIARRDLYGNSIVATIPFSFADWVRLVSSDPSEWRPPEWVLNLPPTTTAPARFSELSVDAETHSPRPRASHAP